MSDKGTCPIEGCPRPVKTAGLCGTHYEYKRLHGTPVFVPVFAEDRFWAKVDKGGPLPPWAPFLGPCWLWTASLDRRGYGQFRGDDSRTWRAHRFSLHLLGTLADDLVVDHLCRERTCVRPDHLDQVTQEENKARGFWQGMGADGMRVRCKHGHDLTLPGAVRIFPGSPNHRRCVECLRIRNEERRLAYHRNK